MPFKDKLLKPKAATLMTSKSGDITDDITAFLTLPTSQSMQFLVNLPTMYGYLELPSPHTLAVLHHLKEEILGLMGQYGIFSCCHMTVESLAPLLQCALGQKAAKNLNYLHSYIYKTLGRLIRDKAERLGAACLLLRMEVTKLHSASQVTDLLVYDPPIEGPHVFTLRGHQGVEQALRNRLLQALTFQATKKPSPPKRTNPQPTHQKTSARHCFQQQQPPVRGSSQGHRGRGKGKRSFSNKTEGGGTFSSSNQRASSPAKTGGHSQSTRRDLAPGGARKATHSASLASTSKQ